MSAARRTRVVAIMPNGPAYDFSAGTSPDFSWTSGRGEQVGFWAREWHDLLGEEVLKLTGDYDWESWQPDLRADREYSAVLPSGVRHRLFPAERGTFRVGLRRQEAVFSSGMLQELERSRGERLVLMLGATYGFHNPFYRALLAKFGPSRGFPIFLRSDGMFGHPLGELFAPHRPLTYLSLLLEHFEVKKLLGYADVASEQSDAGLAALRAVYGGRTERLGMGCDFGFWTPPGPAARAAARAKMGIRAGAKTFFASGNFLKRKQLDKLARVFGALPRGEDFFLLVSGQGPAAAVEELSRLLEPLARQGRGLLRSYAEGVELRDLYWASDVYVSTAADEGGPVSVMKAMACGLPILSTPVGDTADFLRAQSAGRLVPIRDYGAWALAVREILAGALPAPLDVAAARGRYDWPNVAARYVKILDELTAGRYGAVHAG